MIHPILVEEGFSRSLSMDECPADDHNRYVLILRHNGGHLERHWMDAPIDDKGMAGKTNKTRLHGTASSYTYCQNQLLCKVLGVPLVDDDGNSGAGVGPGSEAITLDQSLNLESSDGRGSEKPDQVSRTAGNQPDFRPPGRPVPDRGADAGGEAMRSKQQSWKAIPDFPRALYGCEDQGCADQESHFQWRSCGQITNPPNGRDPGWYCESCSR